MLEDGEVVEAVVAGKLEGNAAVLVLTDRALLLADDRQWRPFTQRMTVDADLQVQGWQDDRTASLTLVARGSSAGGRPDRGPGPRRRDGAADPVPHRGHRLIRFRRGQVLALW